MPRFKLLLIAILVCVASASASVNAVFNWSNPSTLSPSYSTSLSSSNRYGDYIGNVTFSDNDVALVINDDDVSESAEQARFVYNYLTNCIEMRAYANSDIIITAPEGFGVASAEFEGAKADESYMTAPTSGTFKNGSWTATIPALVAKFHVDTTINCTKITVKCIEYDGVNDINANDAAPVAETWYTTLGHKLSSPPTVAGLYIYKKGNTAKTILIR